MVSESVVEISIGMGTGLSVKRYYDVTRDLLSDEYTYALDVSGVLIAYIHVPDEAPMKNRRLVVKDIFRDDGFYKEFQLDLAAMDTPVVSAEFTEGEEELDITFYAGDGAYGETVTCALPVRYDHSLESYDSILKLYKWIVRFCADYADIKGDWLSEALGITDESDISVFNELLSSTYLFYPGRGEEDSSEPYHGASCGYDVKDLNKDGTDELVLMTDDYMIIAVFSIANGKPVLLDSYIPRGSCWIDGNGYLHLCASGGADRFSHTLYRIAQGGAGLEIMAEFGMDGHELGDYGAVEKYYKLENGVKVAITEEEYELLQEQYGKYLGVYAGTDATKETSGLEFKSVFDLEERARLSLNAVLKNKLMVYDTGELTEDKYKYLSGLKAPYSQRYLGDITDGLLYAFVDMDGDGIEELIIDCSDTILLRYFEGKVYAYSFTFRSVYYINTDGSYSWNHTANGHEYGESRLTFNDTEVSAIRLWRIVNDGQPNAEYYIGDNQVTEDEIRKYFEESEKTRVSYTPLDISDWSLTASNAKLIASQYWDISTGDVDGETGYEYLISATPHSSDTSMYAVYLKWLMEYDHYSLVDEVWIKKATGEIVFPYDFGGK